MGAVGAVGLASGGIQGAAGIKAVRQQGQRERIAESECSLGWLTAELVYLMGNIPSVKPFGSTHCVLLGDIHSFGDVFLLNNFCCFFHFLNSLPKHGGQVHGPVSQVNSRRAV